MASLVASSCSARCQILRSSGIIKKSNFKNKQKQGAYCEGHVKGGLRGASPCPPGYPWAPSPSHCPGQAHTCSSPPQLQPGPGWAHSPCRQEALPGQSIESLLWGGWGQAADITEGSLAPPPPRPEGPLCRAILISDPFIGQPGMWGCWAWSLPTPPSINPVTQTAAGQAAPKGALADAFEALSSSPPITGERPHPAGILPPAVPGSRHWGAQDATPGSKPQPLGCEGAAPAQRSPPGLQLKVLQGAAPTPDSAGR